MRRSVRKEVRYWADEFEGFARRFRWALIGLTILTLVELVTTWLPLVWWLNGFVALIFVLRRLRVWGNIDAALHRAQQRSISRHIVAAWPALAQTLRLDAHGPSGSRIAAGIGSPSWDADACLVPLYLPSGLTSGDVGAHLDRIAAAFGARRATLSGTRIDQLELRLSTLLGDAECSRGSGIAGLRRSLPATSMRQSDSGADRLRRATTLLPCSVGFSMVLSGSA